MGEELLFNKQDIFSVVQGQTAAVKKGVQAIPANTLLNASEHDLTQALVAELRLDVPRINDEGIHIASTGETQVDVRHDPMRMVIDRSRPCLVPGTKTVIGVPFTGDPGFFRVQPQTYTMNPPRGELTNGEILLTYVRTDHNAEAIKQEYLRTVASIKDNLRWLTESASQFNNQLEATITSQLKARKERLLADAGMAAAIGLPMKKREGVPVTYAVPVTRRVPRIEQLIVTGAFTPEPALAPDEYDEILRIMKNMVHVMERSPRAFHDMGGGHATQSGGRFFAQPGPRRIDHDQVRRQLGTALDQKAFGGRMNAFHIGGNVEAQIGQRIVGRFHRQHLVELASQRQRKQADSGVEIQC